MIETGLKRLFGDSFLYSLGMVLSRFLTFWLLPLTTSYLTPADYGIVGTLALLSNLLIGLYQIGFNTSIGPVFFTEKNEEGGVVWGAFLTLVLNSILLTILLGLNSQLIGKWLLWSDGYQDLVLLTLLTTAFTACQSPFIFYLRAKQKAKLVVALSIIDILISNALMITFVMVFERGPRGVIEAQAISLGLSCLISALVILPTLPFSFPLDKIKQLITIGAPCIWGFLGFFLLQSASRYMMQLQAGETETGLFFVGSNFAKVIEIALWGFVSAWFPYFNSFSGKKEEAKIAFKKVLSTYVHGMAFLCLLFFWAAKPIATLMVQAPFYSVWTIVGPLSVAQALWGVYVISYAPMVMEKKTGRLAILEIFAGLSCIGFNFILIPPFGKEGAAIATLLAFSVLIVISFICNQRFLKIPYETLSIVKTAIALCIGASASFLPITSMPLYFTVMCVVIAAYLGYTWNEILSVEEKGKLRAYLPLTKKLSEPI